MAKIRVVLEVDCADMNEMLATVPQRALLGDALVNLLWSGKAEFAGAMTLGFYGIKVVDARPIANAVAIVPPRERGWLPFAAMRDWIKDRGQS